MDRMLIGGVVLAAVAIGGYIYATSPAEEVPAAAGLGAEADATAGGPAATAGNAPTAAERVALTPEGFDRERVAAMIDASDLDEARKTALVEAVDAAKDDPAALSEVLARVRDALGITG